MSYEHHGDTGTRLYRIWKSMKCRCNNSNHPSYKWYGERGIKVCPTWENSYSRFKEWSLLNGYDSNLELDRIDVNRGYFPENCRWITHHSQSLNRRDTLYITISNETMRLRDYCLNTGLSLSSVNCWRHRGILEDKLKELTGEEVIISGGKKVVEV